MARLANIGFETGDYRAEGGLAVPAGQTAPTVGSGSARSGGFGASAANGQGLSFAFTGVLGTGYYVRRYIRFSAVQASNNNGILSILNAGHLASVELMANGTLQLTQGSGFTVVGSASSALATNTWHMVELYCNIGTGAVDEVSARLNGVVFASATGLAISESAITRFQVGNDTGNRGTPTFTGEMDDVALNDSTGAANNSWCAVGSLALLKPGGVTNNQLTAATWTDGAGAVTAAALAAASDNTPPVGNTIAASAATDQIENPVKNTAAVYEPVTGTYTAAGVVGAVKVVQGIAVFGQNATTAGQIGLQATTNVGGTATAEALVNGPAAAVAAFPTGWTVARTAVIDNPTPTLANGALVKVRKNLPNSTVAMAVALMGVYVEYDPTPMIVGSAAATGPPGTIGYPATPAAGVVDDFDDNSMAATWTTSGSTVTPVEQNQRVEFPLSPGSTARSGIFRDLEGRTLDGSSLVVRIVDAGRAGVSGSNVNNTMRFGFNPGQANGGPVQFLAKAGNLYASDGSGDTLIGAWDATNHAWLRLRASGGTVFWDTSADGTTWTNQVSRAVSSTALIAPNRTVGVLLIGVSFGAGTGEALAWTGIIDNFNKPPGPVAVTGLAASASGSASATVTVPAPTTTRDYFTGFETQGKGASNTPATSPEGGDVAGTTGTWLFAASANLAEVDTVTVRSGLASMKCTWTATASSCGFQVTFPQPAVGAAVAASEIVYQKVHMYIPVGTANPATGPIRVLHLGGATTGVALHRIQGTNQWQFATANTLRGSPFTLAEGQWHSICIAQAVSSAVGSADYAEGWINGVSQFVDNTSRLTAWGALTAFVGLSGVSSTYGPIYFDDLVVQRSTAAAGVDRPSDTSKIVLMKPALDVGGAGFTGGGGAAISPGATGISGDVDGTPPTGVVSPAAAGTQIKSANANATDYYEAKLGAYTDSLANDGAGMASGDTVLFFQPLVRHANSTTTARQDGVAATANPVIAEALGNTPAAIATAEATSPAGWATLRGGAFQTPGPALGTPPQVKFRRNWAAAGSSYADLLGAYVEYEVAPAAADVTGSASAAGSASGEVDVPQQITASASAAGTTTAQVTIAQDIVGSATGAASSSAAVLARANVTASAAASASASASVIALAVVTGSSAAAATATATVLARANVASATSAGAGSASALVTIPQAIAGSSAGVGTSTASVIVTANVTASAAAAGSAAASILARANVAATATGAGAASAAVLVQALVQAANAPGVGTASATVLAPAQIVASAAATGSSSATVDVPTATPVAITASASAAASSSATVRATAQVVGSATGAASATASVIAAAQVVGSAAAAGTASATVVVTAKVTGSAAGAGTATAAVTAPLLLTASSAAAGSSTATVLATAQITGSATGAGSSTATVVAAAQVTGSAAAVGSSTASVIVTAKVTAATAAALGSASAAVTAPLLLTASSAAAGSAAASVLAPAQVVGSSTGTASAAASVLVVANVTGSSAAAGTSTAQITAVANVTGSSAGTGSAAASVLTPATVTGTASASGSGSAVVIATALVVGSATATGSSAATIVVGAVAISGSAAGSATASAAVLVTALVSGSGAGTGTASASVIAPAKVTGSASALGTATAAVTALARVTGSASAAGSSTASVTVPAPVMVTGSASAAGSSTAVLIVPMAVAVVGSTSAAAAAVAVVLVVAVVEPRQTYAMVTVGGGGIVRS